MPFSSGTVLSDSVHSSGRLVVVNDCIQWTVGIYPLSGQAPFVYIRPSHLCKAKSFVHVMCTFPKPGRLSNSCNYKLLAALASR